MATQKNDDDMHATRFQQSPENHPLHDEAMEWTKCCDGARNLEGRSSNGNEEQSGVLCMFSLEQVGFPKQPHDEQNNKCMFDRLNMF